MRYRIALFTICLLSIQSNLLAADSKLPMYRKATIASEYTAPDTAKIGRADGVVTAFKFELAVSSSGKVDSVKRLDTNGNDEHAVSLAELLGQQTYNPAIRDYNYVPTVVIVEYFFSNSRIINPSWSCPDGISPTIIKKSKIIYPISLMFKSVTGMSRISFTVSEEGRAVNIEPEEYDHELMARHAMIGLKDWAFKPASYDGKYVSCRVSIEFDYTF